MSTTLRPPAASLPAAPLAAPAERIIARVRSAWRRTLLLRALVIGPALLCASAVLLVLIDLVFPLRAVLREGLRWLPPLLGLGWVAWAVYRAARPPRPRRFALLAEERLPALENRLLTVFDRGASAGDGPVARAFAAQAERHFASVEVRDVAPPRLARPAAVLGASLLAALLFALAFPTAAREAWVRWTQPRDAYEQQWRETRARTLPAVPTPPMPVFDEMRWRITPPAYTGLGETEGRGDEPLQALPGSRVRLRSAFFRRWSAVRATRIGGGALPVRREGGEWVAEWTQSPGEKGISLEAIAGGEVVSRQVVPVLVLADRAPNVELTAPEADLVLAGAAGRVPVRATATDDYGMGEFKLSWSRTRGSGESYQYTEGEWQFGSLRRSGRGAQGELVLDLAAMQLQPGDVIHVRAVARDRNAITGPGESVSRTRVIRIARPEEMEEVNTDVGFPMELPKDPLLSQRMLLIRTQRLQAQRGRMPEADFRSRAAEISSDQGRLRERVGEQIFTRSTGAMQDPHAEGGFTEQGGTAHHDEADATAQSDAAKSSSDAVLEAASEATGQGTIDEVSHKHDADPILDVDQQLLALYNTMWAAERALNQSETENAIPQQQRALAIIDQLRKAERIYPSGQVKIEPVNVDSVRGQGKIDEAAPGGRGAGGAVASAVPLLAEMDRVDALLGAASARAASLQLSALAARLLSDPAGDPQAAGMVSRAAGQAASGRVADARALLLRARARLAPSASTRGRATPSTADPAAAEYFRRLGRRG